MDFVRKPSSASRSCGFRWLHRWFLAVLLAGGPIVALVAADELRGPETILAAWKQRQDRVHSLYFEMAEQRTVPKGSFPEGKPPRDFVFFGDYVLNARGTEGRFIDARSLWSTEQSKVVDQRFVTVYKNNVERTLFDKGASRL
ncbi:MAG: hypothetical protein DWQ37_12010 [Planctomycetota bacterium]|nr:MAG: hypothetical protein DWQ37_12010 [Planctomycetota bacterium]